MLCKFANGLVTIFDNFYYFLHTTLLVKSCETIGLTLGTSFNKM